MARIKVKVTSNRNKARQVPREAQLRKKLLRDLASNAGIQQSLKEGIAKRYSKFGDLELEAKPQAGTIKLTIPSKVPETFEERLQERMDQSWVGDANEFAEAVLRRLEGRAKKGPSLHEAVGTFVESNIKYKERKAKAIRKSLGSLLTIK